jgi:hypothetical protein
MTKQDEGRRVERIDANMQSSSGFAIKDCVCPNELSQKGAMTVIHVLNDFEDMSA